MSAPANPSAKSTGGSGGRVGSIRTVAYLKMKFWYRDGPTTVWAWIATNPLTSGGAVYHPDRVIVPGPWKTVRDEYAPGIGSPYWSRTSAVSWTDPPAGTVTICGVSSMLVTNRGSWVKLTSPAAVRPFASRTVSRKV